MTVRDDIRALVQTRDELRAVASPQEHSRLAVEETATALGGGCLVAGLFLVAVPVLIAAGGLLLGPWGIVGGFGGGVAAIAVSSVAYDLFRRATLRRQVARLARPPKLHALSTGSSVAVPTSPHAPPTTSGPKA